MKHIWATSIVCDACGHSEAMPEPKPGHINENPTGWFSDYYLSDIFGRRFMDICPMCVLKPLGEICIMLTNRLKKLEAGEI